MTNNVYNCQKTRENNFLNRRGYTFYTEHSLYYKKLIIIRLRKIISVKIIEGFVIKMRLVKLFDLLNNYYVF